MTFIWMARYGNSQPDMTRCREGIYDNYSHYQCRRKAVVFRCVEGHEGEVGFCKQHDPEAVKARREARDARWRAEWAAREAEGNREAQEKRALSAAKDAIAKIAAGHNDPRSLAVEVLAMFPTSTSLNASTRPSGVPQMVLAHTSEGETK